MKQHSIYHTYGVLRSIVMLCAFTCLWINGLAQDAAKEFPRPTNAKIVSEYDDGKGHIVREIQYTEGSMLVTEQVIMPKKRISFANNRLIDPDTMIKDSVMVFVNKSLYMVQVYYRKEVVRAYRAVFGPNPKQNKCMEGDRCTPEGWFKISAKNPNSKYTRFLQINYPNDSSHKRFNTMKQNGTIPTTAKIGGAIGIHGIWKGGDDMIEMGVGWTDGCIALKNRDIEELYTMIGVGTRVFIKK